MVRTFLLCIIFCIIPVQGVHSEIIGVTKIADTNTPMPGYDGNFVSFQSFIEWSDFVEGDFVVFRGTIDATHQGIYLHDGINLLLVADTTMRPPANSVTYSQFKATHIDNGAVIFNASTGSSGGLYRYENGIIETLVDDRHDLPDSQFVDYRVSSFDVYNGNTVFSVNSSLATGGVYSISNNTISMIANSSTPIPGETTTLSFFNDVRIQDNRIAFVGTFDLPHPNHFSDGLFLYENNSLQIIIGTDTLGPFSNSTPLFLEGIDLFNNQISFNAGSEVNSGIYSYDGSSFSIIADRSDIIPGSNDNFLRFGFTKFVHGNISFRAGLNIINTIFMQIDGTIVKVLDEQEVVNAIGLGGSANFKTIDDNVAVVFHTDQDGIRAIYKLNLSICGDGIIEGLEACDDSNLKNGDGCSDVCTLETGACCHSAMCSMLTTPGCNSAIGTFLGFDTLCLENDSDGDGVRDECDRCPVDNPNDTDGDGACDSRDACPTDPNKIDPGECGCGVVDVGDSDFDGIEDCNDLCMGADDAVFGDCHTKVPTISSWGLVVLTLLLLVSLKVYCGNKEYQ